MGLYFSISALIMIIIFMIVFFTKKRVKNIETTIYKYLLIATSIGLSFDIITAIMYNNNIPPTNIFYIMGSKIVFIYFVVWTSLLSFYIKCISSTKTKKTYKRILYIYLLCLLFVVPFIMILPVHFEPKMGVIVPQGIPVVLTYAVSFLNIIYCLFLAIKHHKNIERLKLNPIYIFCIMMVLNFIIQANIPEAFLINYLLF